MIRVVLVGGKGSSLLLVWLRHSIGTFLEEGLAELCRGDNSSPCDGYQKGSDG